MWSHTHELIKMNNITLMSHYYIPYRNQIHPLWVLALPTKGKDIVFRFITEYYSSSLMDFGPQVVGLFLYEDFRKMIFWLVLKLEILL